MATTRIAMSTVKAAQISKPGAEFELVEREIPKPGAGLRLCHSDVHTKEGQWPKFGIRA